MSKMGREVIRRMETRDWQPVDVYSYSNGYALALLESIENEISGYFDGELGYDG